MDEVIDALIAFMEGVASDMDNIDDAEWDHIMQFIQESIGIIQELKQRQAAIPVPTAQEPLPSSPYPSSNIHAFAYDPKNKKLLVKFQGKDVAAAGPTYSYEGVPSFIFDVFSRGAVAPKTSGSNRWHTWKKGVTPSHGAAMFALIKSAGFPYQRVS